MSISTEIDLLITLMIISSRLDASFLVKVKKMLKMKKTIQITEYIDIALSNLVLIARYLFALVTRFRQPDFCCLELHYVVPDFLPSRTANHTFFSYLWYLEDVKI